MDPLHPIAPGPPAIPRVGPPPVERLKRIARERDRPAKDERERKRREAQPQQSERDPYDGEHPHIDVRA